MTDATRIVVVDDHDLLREGVAGTLRAYDDLEVVGEAATSAQALDLIERLDPDVALIDLILPGTGGVGLIARIRETNTAIGLLVLSSFADTALVHEALDAGADGYLVKSIDADGLAQAVRAIASGQTVFAAEVRTALTKPSRGREGVLAQFTPREREIAELLADGLSNGEIAEVLSVSVFTVKNHVSNILMKLDARSRTEVVALILRDGERTRNRGVPEVRAD